MLLTFPFLVPATVTRLVDFTLHRENGGNATIKFALSNASPPVLTDNIRWYFQTVSEIRDITFSTDERLSLSDNRLTLVVDGITEADEGEYIIRATNEAGTGSNFVVISVVGKREYYHFSILITFVGRPAIINVPINKRRIEGDSVVFSCFATGDPIPQVTWRFNGSVIQTNTSKYSIGAITQGPEFGSLTINDLTYFDKGEYMCTATNVNGSSSVSAMLEIQGIIWLLINNWKCILVVPVVTVHPITQAGIAGGVVTLNCTAYGFPLPAIAWLKDGVVVTSDLIPDGVIMGTQGVLPTDITVFSSLTISNLQLHDVANYTCNVTNNFVEFRSAVANNGFLTVLCEFLWASLALLYNYDFLTDPPNVDVSPETFTVNQTQTTNFTCTSFGIPLPNLFWYNMDDLDTPLTNRNERVDIVETSYYNESGLLLRESVLIFPEALRTDMSSYVCIAVNNIENLLDTPQNGTVVLYVQGQFLAIAWLLR